MSYKAGYDRDVHVMYESDRHEADVNRFRPHSIVTSLVCLACAHTSFPRQSKYISGKGSCKYSPATFGSYLLRLNIFIAVLSFLWNTF